MQRWEQLYELAGGGTVAIEQRSGSVRIVGWDRSAVRVRASWAGAGRIEDRLDVTASGDRISLAVKSRVGWRAWNDRLDLELAVPFGTRCQVESGSGPVVLEETRGPAEVEVGSGPVTLTGLDEAVVETGSGPVRARRINGRVSIEAGSGPVELAEVNGPVVVEAGSGTIEISGLRSDRVEVETGSGLIRLRGLDVRHLAVEAGSGSVEVELVRIRPDGEYQIETGSGRVVVAVPPDAGLRLELETRRRVDLGGLPVRVLHRDDEAVSAVLNGGGPVLTVAAGSGSISLKPCSGQAPAGDREVAATRLDGIPREDPATRLAEIAREDPALEQSEHLRRILQMVQEGRLSVEEAEELLRALDGEEAEP